MTTFYCIDTGNDFGVSVIRRSTCAYFDDSSVSDQMMGRLTGALGLDGFIISSGSDAFPSSCEDEFVTTQPQFDAFLEAVKAEIERANAGASLHLPRASESEPWELVVEEDVSGRGCYNLPVEEFSNPQLEYVLANGWQYRPVEYTEELIKRAGMDPEDCDDPDSYDDLCQAAADKLGFKDVYFN